MTLEILKSDLESLLVEYQTAKQTRDEAEINVSKIAARRAMLAEERANAQSEASKLAEVAMEAAVHPKSTFPGAVQRAVEAENRARYLGLTVAHLDNVTMRAARRAVLVAALAEAESLETLSQARVTEHEETVKAELKRTASVLGDFETDGYGSRHEELLDALESAQDEVRHARQAIAAFDSGETI